MNSGLVEPPGGDDQSGTAQGLERCQSPSGSGIQDELDLLEGELLNPLAQATAAQIERRLEMHMGSFQSPLPPPSFIREYDEILPGSAERILAMAENQAAHRQSMERWVVKNGEVRSYLGLASGLIISLAFCWMSYLLVEQGHPEGVALATGPLVGLVALFITQRKKQERGAGRPDAPPAGTPDISRLPRPSPQRDDASTLDAAGDAQEV